MIVKFVNEKKEDWDVYIDCHVFAYNTGKHASSLYSPFDVMFGRKAILPIELSYNEEGEKLLYDYENPDTQQDRVSKYM
jgi:endonuclease IV